MAFDFKGKTVLITGASMGFGKGLSECLAREGAHLALADLPIREEALQAWAADLSSRFCVQTWALTADLTEPHGPENLYREATGQAGEIDVLVNNAGICWYGDFTDMPLERMERMILLNILAYAKLSRLCLPSMTARNEGAILNVSSISAFQPVPKLSVYGATKAFTQSMSEAVRTELPLRSRVIVTTLNPPFTKTALIEDAGVPLDFIPLLTSFMDVEEVARSGVEAVKKGKARHVPGLYNKAMYLFVVRYLPRSVLMPLVRVLCHRLTDFVPGFCRTGKGKRKR